MKTFALVLLLMLSLSAYAQAGLPAGYTKIASAVPTTSYTDSTCPDATTCYYYVTAVDSAGAESGVSNQAFATIPATGTHTVSLTWSETTTGVTFNVYQHVGPLAPSAVSGVVH